MNDKMQDLSYLPHYAYGSRGLAFWGTAGFMLLDGTGFAIAAGVYLYLMVTNPVWPMEQPPGLFWSSLVTIALLASVPANQRTMRNAERENLKGVRRGLIVMCLFGIAVLVFRAFEFTTLNVKWNSNAYGSILWAIIGLHTAHILTDVVDTAVLTVLMFTAHARGRRFSDVADNSFYWDFVVLSWLPIYALLYWVPRV